MAQPSEMSTLIPAAYSPAWVPTLARQAIPVTIIHQGPQILLNGRRLSVPWSQHQQSLGLADAGLISAVGVTLLNSNDVTEQPLAWFSDPRVTPLNASTWLTKQYRFLDISQLAQQFGWQLKMQGEVLHISTPAAQVVSVRQGTQSWGDRVVVDLNRAAPWQVSENQGEMVVTIHAKLDAKLKLDLMRLAAQPSHYMQSLQLESSGDRTILRISYAGSLRPCISSLNAPNRLLIDLRPDWLVERDIHWAPGLRWQQRWVTIGTGQFPVVKLEIDPQQPGVSLRPILSSASGNVGTAPLFSAARRIGGIAAINAGFFNRNNELPLGAIRSNRRWISGPILNRGAIAWNDGGEVAVGHLHLQETLTTGTGHHWTMQSTNSGYVGAGVARYTPDWGRSYTNIIDRETLLTVRGDRITAQKLSAKAGQTSVEIPSDGYLLVVRANRDILNALAVGTTVQINSTALPDQFNRYAQALGAGPLLVQSHRIVLNPQSEQFSPSFSQEAAPRSVIATTPQGRLLLLTVLNRVGGVGPTLVETAEIVEQLGVVNALNLDGGSSTTLYLGGQILNRAVSTIAPVHNGIGVFIQPNS
jgi:hypothetical protein